MDSQGFGIAAIFNMIQDLGLYDIVSLSPLTLSTVKYSWASSIPAFGLLIVSTISLIGDPFLLSLILVVFSHNILSSF